jgi:serine protease Do
MRRRRVDYRQRFRDVLRLLSLVVGVIVASSRLFSQEPAVILDDSIIKIVEKSESSVVSIARFKPPPKGSNRNGDGHKAFGRDRDPQPRDVEMLPSEFGAGVLICPPKSHDRMILTTYHVVRGGPVDPRFAADDGTTLQISFSDRRSCPATIVAADPRSDLAVLRVRWDDAGIVPTTLPTLNWESAAPVRKGQFVVLLGNPFAIALDGSASVSWGLVSNLTRQPMILNRNSIRDQEELSERSMLNQLGTVMQLDARMNLGTSGGPVLNLKGELIGISTSLAAIEGYDQSVGFAFPIDAKTRRIVRTLLSGQEVEYGMIGIRPGLEGPKGFAELKERLAEEGYPKLKNEITQQSAANVISVADGSPAALVGIEERDIVLSVDGETVRSESDLMRLVGLNAPESVIKLTLWRWNRYRLETVKIKLCKWPATDDAGIIETKPRYKSWRGLMVDFPTSRSRYFDQRNFDTQRVLVTKVDEESPSHAALLQPGNFITHVNGIAVQTPQEFYSAVSAAKGTVALTLSELSNRSDPDFTDRFSNRVVQVRE